METQYSSTYWQDVPTFPNLEGLLPHQRVALFETEQRFKTLVWHRRSRKTTTAITQLVLHCLLKPSIYWHIYPTYNEAKDAVWRDPQMLFRIIPPEIIEKTNESELII